MLLCVGHKIFCEDLKVVIYLIVNQIEESFMHSYLDMSMMIVISTAVVLLLFILVSFILTSHRCSVLEKENAKLKATAEEALKALKELTDKHEEQIQAFERKAKVSESSIQYLTGKLQDITDKQNDINTRFDNLNVKLEQQKKEFENNSVENQPIILAKRLLAQGMSINEVIARTSLPSYEVEMLAKVHNFQSPPPSVVASGLNTAPAQSADIPRSIEDEVNAQRAKFAQQAINTALNEQGTNPRSTHHVASMKARDAYGIGNRSALRRPR